MAKAIERQKKIRVGITHGDINGIGYEIIMKTFRDPRLTEMVTPVVYGSSKVASYHRKALNINDFSFNIISNAHQINQKRANLINCCEEEVKVELGKSKDVAGKLAHKSLEEAVKGIKNNDIQILVTAPINKKNIQSESFKFHGHTEYFSNQFEDKPSLMLMIYENLRLGVVTGHIPLKDVSSHLSVDLVMEKLKILNNSLKIDFGIQKPKIALLGLNPHASDEGLLGSEETEIIQPAIRKVFDEGILAFGPYPADGFIGSRAYAEFDGVLAMYHDQGLIPFKTLAFDSGVNFTAGLPLIRTSPAHGTAYDLAGKNIASPESFRNAVYVGIDVYKNRMMHAELTKNPLVSAAPIDNNKNNSN
ncbi:MAG: 4-hydroxythreonine-4-phosphate dehydrogenase PdxA [Bacteroidetes bacterium]|nr:4-hydroxythreonine-4-phosphate dehydrogenase PdxA [Bacteroidota bacterium]